MHDIEAEYRRRHPGSAALSEQALQVFPSGLTHDTRRFDPFPIYVDHAQGSHKWDADAALLAIAERVRTERPELGLEPSERPIGLTYDVTPVLARGGRGLTFVAAVDGVIPNYHWPTDVRENVEPEAIARALAVGNELVAGIERGEADTGG